MNYVKVIMITRSKTRIENLGEKIEGSNFETFIAEKIVNLVIQMEKKSNDEEGCSDI